MVLGYGGGNRVRGDMPYDDGCRAWLNSWIDLGSILVERLVSGVL